MAEEEEVLEGDQEKPIDEDEKVEEEDEETIRQKEALATFQEDLKAGLSNISKTPDNLSYAYVKLTLSGKSLERLQPIITTYQNLRYLDLSDNSLTDISLISELRFLHKLDVSKNQISSLKAFNPMVDEEIFPYLQFLNLSNNKLKKLENVSLRQLRKLQLNENEITDCSEFTGHLTLEYLELRLNQLKNLQGIRDCPQLKELYLEENQISHLRDLKNLPNLRTIVVAKNKFKKVKYPLPYLPSLRYLNVAENEISSFKEVLKLKVISSLLELSVQGNPLDVEDSKKEILIHLRYFTKVNEEVVVQQDRDDAEALQQERIEEAERVRIEKEREEEERRLQEEAEAAERAAAEKLAQQEAQDALDAQQALEAQQAAQQEQEQEQQQVDQ